MKIILMVITLWLMLVGATYAAGVATPNEFVMYHGRAAPRSVTNSVGNGFAFDFRHDINQNFVTDVEYLNEGHPPGFPKVDGIATEIWWHPFEGNSHRLRFAIGAGPYLMFSTMHSKDKKKYRDAHRLALLVSVDARYMMSHHWALHFGLRRVMTRNHTDVNIIRVGIGYAM